MSFIVVSGFYFVSVLGSLLLSQLLLLVPAPLITWCWNWAHFEDINTDILLLSCIASSTKSQHTTFYIQPTTTQTSMNTSTLRTEKRKNPKPTTMLQVSMQWVGGREISILIASAGRKAERLEQHSYDQLRHRLLHSSPESTLSTNLERRDYSNTFLFSIHMPDFLEVSLSCGATEKLEHLGS